MAGFVAVAVGGGAAAAAHALHRLATTGRRGNLLEATLINSNRSHQLPDSTNLQINKPSWIILEQLTTHPCTPPRASQRRLHAY